MDPSSEVAEAVVAALAAGVGATTAGARASSDDDAALALDYLVYFPTVGGMILLVFLGVFGHMVTAGEVSGVARVAVWLFPLINVFLVMPMYFSPIWPAGFFFCFVSIFGYIGGVRKRQDMLVAFVGAVALLHAFIELDYKGAGFIMALDNSMCFEYYCGRTSVTHGNCSHYCGKESRQLARVSFGLCRWIMFFSAMAALALIAQMKEDRKTRQRNYLKQVNAPYPDRLSAPRVFSGLEGYVPPLHGLSEGGPSRASVPTLAVPSSIYTSFGSPSSMYSPKGAGVAH